MFKSLFTKLMITYLSIAFAVLGLLSLMVSIFYGQYVFDEKQELLNTTSIKVNKLVSDYYLTSITKNELDTAIDALGYVTDSRIFAIRLDNQRLSAKQGFNLDENLNEDFIITDLKKILKGNDTFRKQVFSKKFEKYVVVVGHPLRYDGNIIGAILIFSPVTFLTNLIVKMNLVLWGCSGVIFLIGSFFIYLYSLRISRPLRDMEIQARELASGGDIPDIFISSNDEISSLANAFNYMKHKLSDTEKMRREFIANVSHDLRTPLTSIKGFVISMLEGPAKPEDFKKYLKIIDEETDRLIKMTGEILELAKLQAESTLLVKSDIPVKDLVDHLLKTLETTYQNKNIGVFLSVTSDLIIHADYDRLMQILINIISNSIKYTPCGGSINISCQKANSEAEFNIKDTGIGIPEEEIAFVFEKFYRVDKSRQSEYGGTGLGLCIAKSLVDLHGGSIKLSSKLGIGTEVIIRFPTEKKILG